MVKLLIRNGYSVLAGVRSKTDADRLRASYGEKLYPLIIDVTLHHQVDQAKKEAEKIIGQNELVAIINNAGIVVNGAVLYIPVEEWKQQFDVNLFGVIRTTQTFFP